MYKVEYDEEGVLIHQILTGYWTLEQFRAYEADFLHAVTLAKKLHRYFRIMSEATEFMVQSPEVSHGFAELMRPLVSVGRCPFAIVASSMLNKKQVERVFPYSNVRMFRDRTQARAWLFEDGVLPRE